MNAKRIEQIQSKVMESTTLSMEDKAALLKDLETLKTEAAALPPRAPDPSRGEDGVPEDQPAGSVVNELTSSVAGLEASHPRLTELVNRVAVVLSNMGI